MVTQYAMGETLGHRTFGEKDELVFLGREIGEQRDYSEEVAAQIDKEISTLLTRAHDRAREVLTTFRDKLDAVAEAVIEKETLDRAEFKAIVDGASAAAA